MEPYSIIFHATKTSNRIPTSTQLHQDVQGKVAFSCGRLLPIDLLHEELNLDIHLGHHKGVVIAVHVGDFGMGIGELGKLARVRVVTLAAASPQWQEVASLEPGIPTRFM